MHQQTVKSTSGYGPVAQALQLFRLQGRTLSFSTVDPLCPRCGGELRRSPLLPHGEDLNGVVYMARFCRDEGMMFGRATDGSWSVPVTGIDFN
jgi:hypothetical protein